MLGDPDVRHHQCAVGSNPKLTKRWQPEVLLLHQSMLQETVWHTNQDACSITCEVFNRGEQVKNVLSDTYQACRSRINGSGLTQVSTRYTRLALEVRL